MRKRFRAELEVIAGACDANCYRVASEPELKPDSESESESRRNCFAGAGRLDHLQGAGVGLQHQHAGRLASDQYRGVRP
jgi:hypothetical protein